MHLIKGLAEWPAVPIRNLCVKVTSGGTPSRKESSYYSTSGIPWLKTQEIRDEIVWDAEEHITEAGLARSSAKLLPANTVLVAMYGSPTAGKLAILGAPMACNQACCALIVDPDKVDHRFLYYSLLAGRDTLISLANGAAQQNLSTGIIASASISVPPLSEQKAIASLLGALDDKIAVNERIMQKVDELGKALFKACFAEALAHLTFGHGLPDTWKISTLGEMTSVFESGSRPRGGVAAYLDGVPSIGAESIVRLASFDFDKVKFVPLDFFSAMKRGVLEDRDVLLYKDGGRPGKFEPHVSLFGEGFPFSQMCINEHVYRLRFRRPLTQEYGYFWLSSDPILDEMRMRGTGVAVPGLNSTAAKGLPMIVPSDDRLDRFDTTIGPMVRRALLAARESRVLAQVRDTLLPRLISGELRIKDAEQLVSEVA